MPSVHRKINQRGRGPCPASFLREREWARPWPPAGTRLRPGRLCPPLYIHSGSNEALIFSYSSDDGSKRSASEERTSSRICKSMVLCRYPGPRESVHIKLLVSSVSFSHNNVRLLMVYHPHEKFAYRPICRFRD